MMKIFKNRYSPVGLDLGGRSPEEIALSVIAEIVKIGNELDY